MGTWPWGEYPEGDNPPQCPSCGHYSCKGTCAKCKECHPDD